MATIDLCESSDFESSNAEALNDFLLVALAEQLALDHLGRFSLADRTLDNFHADPHC